MSLELKTYPADKATLCLSDLSKLYEEEKNVSVLKLITHIEKKIFKGWVSVLLDQSNVVSCAAVENSFQYTSEEDSLRFCRYYKSKRYRVKKYNLYPFLDDYIKIGKKNNFKVIYFTVFSTSVFKHMSDPKFYRGYQRYNQSHISVSQFNLRKDILFKINDNCVQRIFEYKIDKNFDWTPEGPYIIPNIGYSDADFEQMYKYSLKNGMV